jgi:hypothetical protein
MSSTINFITYKKCMNLERRKLDTRNPSRGKSFEKDDDRAVLLVRESERMPKYIFVKQVGLYQCMIT